MKIISTKIIAAWCGTGKTYFCNHYDRSSVEVEYWMYKDKQEDKYIRDIEKNFGNVEFIFISTDPQGLKPIIDKGYQITLVYPKNELRNEYLDRYIDRDSPYDFIGTFMKHWNTWIDELKNIKYCEHIILNSGQYLSDVL